MFHQSQMAPGDVRRKGAESVAQLAVRPKPRDVPGGPAACGQRIERAIAVLHHARDPEWCWSAGSPDRYTECGVRPVSRRSGIRPPGVSRLPYSAFFCCHPWPLRIRPRPGGMGRPSGPGSSARQPIVARVRVVVGRRRAGRVKPARKPSRASGHRSVRRAERRPGCCRRGSLGDGRLRDRPRPRPE
jgi:hypothetical protein